MNLRLSVIVPTFNADSTLPECLQGLRRAIGTDDEVIVADDGSPVPPMDVVESIGDPRFRLVASPINIGRGPVRNLGASKATGDVVVFVDADVVVHEDALEMIRSRMSAGSSCLFGSYDDAPPAGGIVSKYRNLLHHFTHQTKGRSATHFWTGLGAVRRDVYLTLGGLNKDQWARNMEDVEFGHRVVDAGLTVDVHPEIQGTHLKNFTFGRMVRTDLFNRAVPWSRLILEDPKHLDRFVVSWSQRMSAILTGIIGASLLVSPFLPAVLLVTLACTVMFAALNRKLLRFFTRRMGIRFAFAALILHMVHSGLSLLGFVAAVSTAWRRH